MLWISVFHLVYLCSSLPVLWSRFPAETGTNGQNLPALPTGRQAAGRLGRLESVTVIKIRSYAK